jgi:hypothetical protein
MANCPNCGTFIEATKHPVRFFMMVPEMTGAAFWQAETVWRNVSIEATGHTPDQAAKALWQSIVDREWPECTCAQLAAEESSAADDTADPSRKLTVS